MILYITLFGNCQNGTDMNYKLDMNVLNKINGYYLLNFFSALTKLNVLKKESLFS